MNISIGNKSTLYCVLKSLLLTILLISFITSCTLIKKEKRIVEEPYTANSSITSVIESSNILISEGNIAFLNGDFLKAIKFYEDGLNHNRAIAYYNIGVCYYLLHQLENSEKSFRLAIQEDANFQEALMNLVAVLAAQGKSIEAEFYVDRLVGKSKTARIYIDMANLALRNNSTAKATYYYEKALDIEPKSLFVVSNYASYLISIGHLDRSEEILTAIPNKDFTILYNLAYINWLNNIQTKAYEYAIQAKVARNHSEEGADMLAALLNNMGRYKDESDVLRELVNRSGKKDYRVRLVYSYIHIWNLESALDEAKYLLQDHPYDNDSIMAYYRVSIANDEVLYAGDFLMNKFKERPSDFLLYQNVRHISLYESDLKGATQLLNTSRQTPYLNLARTAYYSRLQQYLNVKSSLDRVPIDLDNDYYIYKTLLAFKDKDYAQATTYASKIYKNTPEYFWYNLAIRWNERQPGQVRDLVNKYNGNNIVAIRVPEFTYSLSPVIRDIPFVYPFDAKGEDMASLLMYPFFIEPDEMNSFLILGYKLLMDDNPEPALMELRKSIEYSNAIEMNNKGVQNILNGNYDEAIKQLSQVEGMLNIDPFWAYNLGLAYYRSGDIPNAIKNFEIATTLNKFFSPAYVALGLSHRIEDNPILANEYLDEAVTYSNRYRDIASRNYLPMVTNTKYLAYLAQERPSLIHQDLGSQGNDNNFLRGMRAIANYLPSYDISVLDELNSAKFYNGEELKYLIDLNLGNIQSERKFDDKNILMYAKYIIAKRDGKLSEMYITPYLNDREVLNDLINLSILLGDKQKSLKYLQRLNNLGLEYPPLYRSALYYYMWQKDYINAEGAYTSLSRVGYSDKFSDYYMMLYFLLNYEPTRFSAQVEKFSTEYPHDYRGKVLYSLKELEEGNVQEFFKIFSSLTENEQYLFDDISLEIDFEKF